MKWNMVVADGSTWAPPPAAAAASRRVDGVLVDVSCPATGTASKRPDVLRRSVDSLDALLDTQFRLACNSADTICAVGGILVYATCSILRQESEEQVLKLLQRSSTTTSGTAQLRMLPFQPGELPGFDACIDTDHGWVRVLPGDHGENGPTLRWLFCGSSRTSGLMKGPQRKQNCWCFLNELLLSS